MVKWNVRVPNPRWPHPIVQQLWVGGGGCKIERDITLAPPSSPLSPPSGRNREGLLYIRLLVCYKWSTSVNPSGATDLYRQWRMRDILLRFTFHFQLPENDICVDGKTGHYSDFINEYNSYIHAYLPIQHRQPNTHACVQEIFRNNSLYSTFGRQHHRLPPPPLPSLCILTSPFPLSHCPSSLSPSPVM